jgi:hypothetical protein
MKKTTETANKIVRTTKLFELSLDDLKLVTGGQGVIVTKDPRQP